MPVTHFEEVRSRAPDEIVRVNSKRIAKKALSTAASFWFLVAATGQLLFVYYIAVFYGGTALLGDFEAWTKVLIHGIIPGDFFGNLAVFAHILLAFIITAGGILQLIPAIRARFPTFHRWNGRVYMATAFLISIGGIYMILSRGTIGGISQHIAICLNAVLIIVFAAIALRRAMARDIKAHRRWALRLFLAVSGVWFFRVGLMLWNIIHGAPVGFDPATFTGPFLTFLAFAQYLLPLAVLELYFYAQDSVRPPVKFLMASTLTGLTLLMGIGIFGAFMGMWLPKI